MPIGGGAGIDGAAELEVLANTARRENHDFPQDLFQPALLNLAGSMQIDEDR